MRVTSLTLKVNVFFRFSIPSSSQTGRFVSCRFDYFLDTQATICVQNLRLIARPSPVNLQTGSKFSDSFDDMVRRTGASTAYQFGPGLDGQQFFNLFQQQLNRKRLGQKGVGGRLLDALPRQ
jgi:hypothetical protein